MTITSANLPLQFVITDLNVLCDTLTKLAAENERENEREAKRFDGWQAGHSSGRAAAYTIVAKWIKEIVASTTEEGATP